MQPREFKTSEIVNTMFNELAYYLFIMNVVATNSDEYRKALAQHRSIADAIIRHLQRPELLIQFLYISFANRYIQSDVVLDSPEARKFIGLISIYPDFKEGGVDLFLAEHPDPAEYRNLYKNYIMIDYGKTTRSLAGISDLYQIVTYRIRRALQNEAK